MCDTRGPTLGVLGDWAKNNPDRVAPEIQRVFKLAADAWIRGNNSRSDAAMCEGLHEQDWLHSIGLLMCSLYGINKVEFPGLYPVYVRGDRVAGNRREWHYGDELNALREASSQVA